MDVLAVHLAMTEAVEHMRAGLGPTMIEADTYRYFHQNGPFPGSAFGYRTKDEEKSWRERDPIDQLSAHLIRRRFGTLSEGERKRVQIARALMPDPELLFLDEPAAGLDLGGREDLVRRIARLAADGTAPTMVLVTHHVEEVPAGFTHALLMRRGSVLASGRLDRVFTEENLSKCFGVPLAIEHRNSRWSARTLL